MAITQTFSGLQHASNVDFTPYLIAFSAICLVLSSSAIGARCSSRWMSGSRIGGDDVFAVISYLGLLATIIGAFIIASSNGVGLGPTTLAQVRRVDSAHLSITFTFGVTLVAGKTSLLFLYRRIFGMRQLWFRIIWWTTFIISFPLLFIADIAITAVLASSHGHETAGIDYAVFAETFVCAVTNLAILILPIGMVLRLQLDWPKRAGLICIFSLGSIASALEFVRSARIIQQQHELWDPRYASYEDLMLSLAETTAVVICACLGLMRPLFTKIKGFTLSSAKSVSRGTRLGGSRRAGSRASFQCKGPNDEEVGFKRDVRDLEMEGPGENELGDKPVKGFEHV